MTEREARLTRTRRGRGQMTSLAAVAIAPRPAGATLPSRLIARRALKPIPRRSKVAPDRGAEIASGAAGYGRNAAKCHC